MKAQLTVYWAGPTLGNGATVSTIYAENIKREITLQKWKLPSNVLEDSTNLIFKEELTKSVFIIRYLKM
jgi:hypothetical protein